MLDNYILKEAYGVYTSSSWNNVIACYCHMLCYVTYVSLYVVQGGAVQVTW